MDRRKKENFNREMGENKHDTQITDDQIRTSLQFFVCNSNTLRKVLVPNSVWNERELQARFSFDINWSSRGQTKIEILTAAIHDL